MVLRAALVLIGFTAVIAQIVLMRELMVVFYGNEISIGLILASWLLWTAFGSSILGRLGGRVSPKKLVATLEALISVAFPLSIFLVRASRTAFQAIPGEMLGPGPMIFTSFVTLSLFCAISGWLFAAGSRLYASGAGASTAEATGSVYLLEGVGSGAGGLLAGLFLIRHLDPFEIAFFVALLNLLAAVSLTIPQRLARRVTIGALGGIFALLVFPFVSRQLKSISLAELWRGFHLVDTRNSIYGNLAVVSLEGEGNATLFENGLAVLTVPDPAAAEEAVHFALLQHPSPKSLLLIGGGVNGSVAQALQHPSLERLDYVELDPAILELARKHFPKQWAPIANDRRVHVHNTDGCLFLKTTQSRFDVIVVNLPDPQTAQLNRFYTLEFFREAARRLTRTGVFSFQLTGAENYVSPGLAQFLRCINKTLRMVFPEVVVIPGDTIHFFAATQPGILAADAGALLSRLRARHLQTLYVREYYLPFRMMPDRIQDLASQIRPRPETPVNRDFAPIAYYFDVALWSTRFSRGYRELFESVARVNFTRIAIVCGLLLIMIAGLLRWLRPKEQRPRLTAGFCVAAMGFTLIGLEMLLLLAFQAIYGYVYYQLAIVISCLMAGMALGSWRGVRRVAAGTRSLSRQDFQSLAALQILAAVSGLLLFALFYSFAQVKSPVGLFLVIQILFPVLALLSGTLGGYQFPLASRIFFAVSENGLRSPGTLYGLDLVGACLGAVLFSAYLIPVFGLFKTALLIAVINLAPALLAALSFSQASAGAHRRPGP